MIAAQSLIIETSDGGEIQVEASPDGSTVDIDDGQTGIAIDAEDLPELITALMCVDAWLQRLAQRRAAN